VDAGFFRNEVILPLLETRKSLVLVLHSYTGASVGGAVQGLTVQERQQKGLSGGMLGLVCITALCLLTGMSIQYILEMTDELAPWTTVDVNDSICFHETPKLLQFSN
jgi:hypothetical protein